MSTLHVMPLGPTLRLAEREANRRVKDKSYRRSLLGQDIGRYLRALRWSEHAENTIESYEGTLARLALEVLRTADRVLTDPSSFRVMAWVKPFAAFKANVSVAYAWEPVLVKAARKPVVKQGMTYRDWLAEPITLKRGLTGAKPERVCHWLFEVMGCEPEDELDDLLSWHRGCYASLGDVVLATHAVRGSRVTWALLSALSIYALAFIVADLRRGK